MMNHDRIESIRLNLYEKILEISRLLAIEPLPDWVDVDSLESQRAKIKQELQDLDTSVNG